MRADGQGDADNGHLEAAIRRVLRGQREAYAQVVERCERDLRLWLAARCPLAVDSDEIAQRTFIAAYEHLRRYRPGGSVRAWLIGIARNLLARELRRIGRERTVSVDSHLPAVASDVAAADGLIAAALRFCLGRLHDHHRQALLWRHADARPVPEVAERLGRSPTATTTLLSKLRRRLVDCIERRAQALRSATDG